jgi:hypothetical protein
MLRKLLIVAAMLTAGCDDPAVHAKAVNVLTNGLIAGEVKCSGQWFVGTTDGAGASPAAPDSGIAVNSNFFYRAQKFQDGSCFMSWSETSTSPSVYEFIPVHDSKHLTCEVGTQGGIKTTGASVTVKSSAPSARYIGGPRNNCSSWEYYLPSPSPVTVFDMSTQCTGFNFDVFGVE